MNPILSNKIPIVTLTKVDFVLGDVPQRLRGYADWIDQTVHYGTDTAEQLRGDAAMLENLALAWAEREQA